MLKSVKRAIALGMTVDPLYCAVVQYKTPSGKTSYASHYVRGTEQDAYISAIVRTCANPKRKVLRGVDGCKVNLVLISDKESI